MEITENKLMQYLIGNLPEEESEQIDLQIISSPEFEAEMILAEDHLMEAYLEDTLSPEEIELFHQNFLVSDERKEQLRQLSLITDYAQKNVDPEEETTDQPVDLSGGFYQKLKNLFGKQTPVFAAIAFLLTAGVLLGIYFYRSSDNEIAAINRQDLSNPDAFKALSNLSLISGSFRDHTSAAAAAGQVLEKDKLSKLVLIRLALPVAIGERNNTLTFYAVKISQDRNTIAELDTVRSYGNQTGQELRLLIPEAILQKGSYTVEAVPAADTSEPPFIYAFQVR